MRAAYEASQAVYPIGGGTAQDYGNALAEASGIGARPGVLVLTLPDNPTGTVASEALVREVCEIADAAGLLIVCDEIYRDLAHDPGAFVSPA